MKEEYKEGSYFEEQTGKSLSKIIENRGQENPIKVIDRAVEEKTRKKMGIGFNFGLQLKKFNKDIDKYLGTKKPFYFITKYFKRNSMQAS